MKRSHLPGAALGRISRPLFPLARKRTPQAGGNPSQLQSLLHPTRAHPAGRQPQAFETALHPGHESLHRHRPHPHGDRGGHLQKARAAPVLGHAQRVSGQRRSLGPGVGVLRLKGSKASRGRWCSAGRPICWPTSAWPQITAVLPLSPQQRQTGNVAAAWSETWWLRQKHQSLRRCNDAKGVNQHC